MHEVFNLINEVAIATSVGKIYLNATEICCAFTKGQDLIRGTKVHKNLQYRDFKKAIGKKEIKAGDTVSVTGIFYPGCLLLSGWWDSSRKASNLKIVGDNPLQEWFRYGFEEWAPSWESSLESQSGYLFGQLGQGDEGESILLICPDNKAEEIRFAYNRSKGLVMTKHMTVSGRFMTPESLPDSVKKYLSLRLPKGWDKETKNCIVIGDDAAQSVQRLDDTNEIYSGYLWQCLYPEDGLEHGKPSDINKAIFLWEHANFSNEKAMKFHLDSLKAKRKILQKETGKLTLLQRSSWIVEKVGDEKPKYNTEEFQKYVLRELDNKSIEV